MRQFLGFLAEHLGGAPSLKALAALTPADVRAFLAARRSEGVGSRSLMRTLAGLRSFARYLEREGKGKTARAHRGARAEDRQDPAAAIAGASAKRLADPGLAPAEAEPWIQRARRRGAGAPLRQRAAHFRSAGLNRRRFHTQ